MFKFAKYFFIVFLITTVIPLTLMLVWNHNQMERMKLEREQHLLYVGSKQVEYTINQYLKIRESYILEKIQNLSTDQISVPQLQKAFNTDKVEFIKNKPVNKVLSYYDILYSKDIRKPELYCVTLLPIKASGMTGIKLLEKVDFNQLRPPGPFDINIYVGNKINKSTYLGSAKDMFRPDDPFMDPHRLHRDRPPFDKEQEKNGEFIPMPPDSDLHQIHPDRHPLLNREPGKNEEFMPPDADINFHQLHPERTNLNANIIENKNIKYKKISIADNKGKIVATLTINVGGFLEHKELPENPVENEFGLLVLIAGSITSLLIGYHINKNFINPLLILSNASKQVQEGNLSIKLVTNIKQKQILNTFNNFNQMLKGLREKDELRSSFITNLTHDLRTPLIAQERALQLISKEFEALGLTDAYKLAKGTEKNTQHLLRMVNLILESYSFDSENLNLLIQKVNISDLLDVCFEHLNPLASEKNIQLVNEIPKDFPAIDADKTSINRIFINLISNSIDSISNEGCIKITAEPETDFVKITVEDNGPGIAKEDIMYIFDRHYTGKSGDRKIGSGLGLYVCKKLIELHNGEITVESEINNYTKFIIKLPREYREV